jgi:hypothetical protein
MGPASEIPQRRRRKTMALPIDKVKLSLKSATPTRLTAVGLKTQLTNIGLTCDDTLLAVLDTKIQEVRAQIPGGSIQSFGILQPRDTTEAALTGLLANLKDTATGNWTPDDVGQWQTKLAFIQQQDHFTWLKTNRSSTFGGIENNPPQYSDIVATIDAIQKQFIMLGVNASATLIKGLDKTALEAILSNAIAPVTDKNASDYNPDSKWDSRLIYLVDNYNPVTKEADGVGVLTIEWLLRIKDYKVKKQEPSHDTKLTVKSRSILYTSGAPLEADYAASKAQFREHAVALGVAALGGIPINPTKVTIFPKRPPAVEATFNQSLLKKSQTGEVEVIVLYAPDLQIIGSIDNTKSATTTTYSESVTTGFTFSTTQELSIAASLEADFEVVKAGLTVTASISFTEEWSQSRTVSMSFEVPPGKKAFNYQGYILAEILSYDTKAGTYSYTGNSARCLTNVLTSTNDPIDKKMVGA